MDRQTLYFTVANFFAPLKHYTFSKKNPNENESFWAILAAPVAANSEKKCISHVVVVAVVDADDVDVDDEDEEDDDDVDDDVDDKEEEGSWWGHTTLKI